MSRWLDLAAQIEAGEEPGANSANSATSPQKQASASPIGPNDTIGTALPPALVDGLERLCGLPAPNVTRPDLWPSIVADAQRLVAEGWAVQALRLGWTAEQLFGCSPQVGGDWELEGLAVQLCGRRIVLLDEASAIMESAAGSHTVFHRRPTAGAVMLWELG